MTLTDLAWLVGAWLVSVGAVTMFLIATSRAIELQPRQGRLSPGALQHELRFTLSLLWSLAVYAVVATVVMWRLGLLAGAVWWVIAPH